MSAHTENYIVASPISDWFGFSVETTDTGAVYGLAFDESHIGNPLIRALHGGVIGAFLEFAAQCELTERLDNGAAIKTVNVDIDYLASSKAADMKASATITRLGRRIAFVEATGWQDDPDRPVAKARLRIRIGTAQ
ncbi:MAG: thioesterase [Hyphococcus sp.]|nr:MAG: thioesterase [Marinicaulis sp.]